MLYYFNRFFVVLTTFLALFALPAKAEAPQDEEKGFDAAKVILGHVADAYDWHFFDIPKDDGTHTPVAIPLPIIAYSAEGGLQIFSSAKFHHGSDVYNGYALANSHYQDIANVPELRHGKIVAVDAAGNYNPNAKFYDLSITKNVANLLISVLVILWMFLALAKKYARRGVDKAPTGFQNFLEMVIVFVRDEVARPNIGRKFMKFMPLLLTMFFFIWINNMLGLIPGGANFTGNIAVTGALALVTFIVMLFSANKHFWGHLFNPPGVPMGINVLLVIIEVLSLFIKPIALMIRLFANILAGHIILLSVISMIFIFGAMNAVAGWGFAPVSIAFSIFMYFLEFLVAAIQAFIFTNLTAVFIGQSVEEHHADDHGHGADGIIASNPANVMAEHIISEGAGQKH